MDSLDSQSKVYVILLLMMLFMILQMAIKRKKALKKTRFPFMVNAFKADYSAFNPLKIMYYISYEGISFEVYPILSNDIHEFLSDRELNKKFNERTSKSYYIMVKLKSDTHDLNQLIKDFSLKFNIVKLETKVNSSTDLYIKETFTQFNLDRITKYLGKYLKEFVVHSVENEVIQGQSQIDQHDLLQ